MPNIHKYDFCILFIFIIGVIQKYSNFVSSPIYVNGKKENNVQVSSFHSVNVAFTIIIFQLKLLNFL